MKVKLQPNQSLELKTKQIFDLEFKFVLNFLPKKIKSMQNEQYEQYEHMEHQC